MAIGWWSAESPPPRLTPVLVVPCLLPEVFRLPCDADVEDGEARVDGFFPFETDWSFTTTDDDDTGVLCSGVEDEKGGEIPRLAVAESEPDRCDAV